MSDEDRRIQTGTTVFRRLRGLSRGVRRFDCQMAIAAKAHHECRHDKLTDQQVDQEAAEGKSVSMIPVHTVRIASFPSESLHLAGATNEITRVISKVAMSMRVYPTWHLIVKEIRPKSHGVEVSYDIHAMAFYLKDSPRIKPCAPVIRNRGSPGPNDMRGRAYRCRPAVRRNPEAGQRVAGYGRTAA